MHDALDNLTWLTMSGPHHKFTAGTHEARRYVSGFPPFVGFADPANADLRALEPYTLHGEHLYCNGWTGVPPPGWRIDSEAGLLTMVWEGPMPVPVPAPDIVPLNPAHGAAVLDLLASAPPGPFGWRSLELGEYVGIVEGRDLVAVAGSRDCAAGWSEVYGVCTDPAHQGRGLAGHLVSALVRRQIQRQRNTFLRVLAHNTGAIALYHRLGFRRHSESLARVVSRS